MRKGLSVGILTFVSSFFMMAQSASADTLVGTYDTTSSPALADSGIYNSFVSGNFLYVSTQGGLSVINTGGTETFADDTLVGTYTTSSSPAIVANIVRHTTLSGNLLYITTDAGVSVIDTAGTETFADDTLIDTVEYVSTPFITSNTTRQTFVSGNLLYISTDDGLAVIDTNGTSTFADDTVFGTYNTASSPVIISNSVYYSMLTAGNILYITTDAGVSVIDTNGTGTFTDDTNLGTYDGSSTPSIVGLWYPHILLSGNLLYISSLNSGVYVINTQGTSSLGDDTLVGKYDYSSAASIEIDAAQYASVSGNLVFIAAYNGSNGSMFVIDTQGTESLTDDIVIKKYAMSGTPLTIQNGGINTFFYTGSLLYLNTFNGVVVIGGPFANDASDTITLTLPVNGTISITAPADVTMGAITSTGQSALTTNSATWNVKTNNASGYSLAWQASAAPMTNLTADTIAAYTPTTANTPEAWSVASTDSEWGAHLASTSDIVDTGVWGTGDDYTAGNWLNVDNTAPYTIATSTSETTITGDDETVIFGGEIGSSKIQPTGNYSVDITMTATTL